MLVKEMFTKPINREMQGVIVVGQDDNANIQQELEEYVVTSELQKHFRDFFANYKKGINGTTPKMGVWISGFFGSGKSHFLKILSYLLENRVVGGKTALQYFIDDKKIEDPAVLADMQLATQIPTDVIAFNIASKSDNSGNKNKDAIVNVFLRVFNEMQGFCGAIPWVADLERKLSKDGRYDEFKERYEAIAGEDWLSSRDEFDYAQDDVIETLVAMDYMSEDAARNWCEKAMGDFSISIEDFAKGVKRYLDRKDKNHHIVFLIDEVGQYIGDDSQLMLDLQTVTEELGKTCDGKVWIVVTSQQDIDKVTKVRGNDFSKIQGRFDTRLSLSSANVDAIIKKRILEKTDTAATTLRLMYDEDETLIKNLITFNDTVEKKLYANADDFAAVYPFIPYQFKLLSEVLNSIRTHGASGKHLSEGERSMLAMFKEAAMAYGKASLDVLIPLHTFYDAMENFLDHNHRAVIQQAYDNSLINPTEETDVFAVNVLKTLFLIKYVGLVTANIDNLTTLMIDNIHDDRVDLKEKVEQALKVLISQNLVEKSVNTYKFLTDEEQEINREINSELVEVREVTAKVGELIFDDLLTNKSYRYPKYNGRYTFPFNPMVDGVLYKKNVNGDIALHVITPVADIDTDEMSLRGRSRQEKSVLIVLPAQANFVDELYSYLRIEKFLRRNTTSTSVDYEKIKNEKRSEMKERLDGAKLFLRENLKEATIYVNESVSDIGAKDIASRAQEALGKLVQTVYSKLTYIDAPMDDDDILKVLKGDDQQSFELGETQEANRNALEDVLRFISDNTSHHQPTSMKTLKDQFMKAPYGFVDTDVEWLVARLFKRGDLAFTVSGESITLVDYTAKTIFEYITKKQYVEKLLMNRRERVSEREKKAVKKVLKDLLDVPSGGMNDEDALMKIFREKAAGLKAAIKLLSSNYNGRVRYPGDAVVRTGVRLLDDMTQPRVARDFFKAVRDKEDELLDLAEDLRPIQKFFAGEQRGIFDTAYRTLAIYDDSKVYIVNEELEQVVRSIRQIIAMPKPYHDIPKLPQLIEDFNNIYLQILEEAAVPVRRDVSEYKQRILDSVSEKPYCEEVKPGYMRHFDELLEKVESSQKIPALRSLVDQAKTLMIRYQNEMNKRDTVLAQPKPSTKPGGTVKENGGGETAQVKPVIPSKQHHSVSIRNVVRTNSWSIENAADVDKCVDTLRQELLKQLKDDTVIDIEF